MQCFFPKKNQTFTELNEVCGLKLPVLWPDEMRWWGRLLSLGLCQPQWAALGALNGRQWGVYGYSFEEQDGTSMRLTVFI